MARLAAHLGTGAALALLLTAAAPAADVVSEWLGGAGSWTDPDRWNTADYPHNNGQTYEAVIDSGTQAAVALDAALAVDGFLVGSGEMLTLDDGAALTLASGPAARTVTNRGALTLDGADSPTYLHFYGDVTLDGGGAVTLADSDRNRIVGEGQDVTPHLVNQDNTIRGAGWIGQAFHLGEPTAVSNGGLIDANQPTALTVKAAAGGTNTGTLRASAGGTLVLDSGAWTNGAGVIEALAGSTVGITSHATVTGGTIRAADGGVVETSYGVTLVRTTLSTTGSGVFRAVENETTLDGGAAGLTNAGTFEVGDAAGVTLKGSVTNTGTLAVSGSLNVTSLFVGGEVTLDGGGTVVLADGVTNRLVGTGPSPHLVNVDNTIRGAGHVGRAYATGVPTALTNGGTVTADQATDLTVKAESGGTNTGTLRARDGATLVIDSGAWTNAGGVIEALDASTVRITNGATVTGGTLRSAGTGVVRVTDLAGLAVGPADPLDVEVADLATIVLDGALDNTAGGTLTKTGGGTLLVHGPQDHGPGALLEILAGTVELHSDASGTGLMADADLSVQVAAGELLVGADQHLDTLDIADGARVRLAGAQTVAVRHLILDGTDLGAATLTPEPGALALLAAGALGTLIRRRRR
jgi:hypothetical protein